MRYDLLTLLQCLKIAQKGSFVCKIPRGFFGALQIV